MINKPTPRSPKHAELRSQNQLHVVAVISNPVRYSSRYRLYEEFERSLFSGLSPRDLKFPMAPIWS